MFRHFVVLATFGLGVLIASVGLSQPRDDESEPKANGSKAAEARALARSSNDESEPKANGSKAAEARALARSSNQANLSVDYAPDDSALECDNARACFDVKSEKNISHIFVDVTFTSSCDPAPYEITVNGVAVGKDRLRAKGGPCNKDSKKVPRTVWFPLSANQKSAAVCVIVHDAVPAEVRVGAKSADECTSDAATAACTSCSEPDSPDDEDDRDDADE